MENLIIFLIIVVAAVTFSAVVILRARANTYWSNRFDGSHGTTEKCVDRYYEYRSLVKAVAAVGGACLVILAFVLVSVLI